MNGFQNSKYAHDIQNVVDTCARKTNKLVLMQKYQQDLALDLFYGVKFPDLKYNLIF